MFSKVVLRQMGGSIGATLPKDIAERLSLKAGDEVYIMETDSGILLTPYDPNFGEAMDACQRGTRRYRNALRVLAKGE